MTRGVKLTPMFTGLLALAALLALMAPPGGAKGVRLAKFAQS